MATLDHMVLRVTSFETAAQFYRPFFRFAEFEEVPDPQDPLCLGFRTEGGLTIWIEEHQDLAVGKGHGWLDHFALFCDNNEEVDRAHQFCLQQGWEILSAPKAYPAYGNFYGFSLRGPDEIKLEFVTR